MVGYAPHGGLFGVPEKKKKEGKDKKKKSAETLPTIAKAVETPPQKEAPTLSEKPEEEEEPTIPTIASNESKNDDSLAQVHEEHDETTSDEGDDYHSADEEGQKEEPKKEASNAPELDSANEIEAEEWKHQQLEDLTSGNKLSAQRRFQRLICDYFRPDKESGELIFLDDGTSKVRGSDLRRLVNFFVPLKNIHPKSRPNGIPAIVEVLRVRKLNYASIFPNENLKAIFAELGNKPTAFQDRIKRLEQQRKQILSIAESLKESNESKTGASTSKPSNEDWSTFA